VLGVATRSNGLKRQQALPGFPDRVQANLEPWDEMRAVELVFAVGWAAFWLYWLVAAFSAKRGRVA
jgi:hypothetical protein